MKLNGTDNILISDTIGFIQNLPSSLIDAFKSTLMESVNADVLFHVIDITDEKMELKIKIVEDILKELNIEEKPCVYVFNKIDTLPHEDFVEKIRLLKQKYSDFTPQFISVKEDVGVEEIKNHMLNSFFQD